ncbi:Zinc finger CCHC-type protein [Dioscorea alata]|uniref:Zinc finger CCHC-type protein n=1 Tax=Dioscorea alata TaxID=55571 RepID=A0ACB7W2C1_DIOAL|nr:Zinc finger CCHC-type protein [Dioscorea alata]
MSLLSDLWRSSTKTGEGSGGDGGEGDRGKVATSILADQVGAQAVKGGTRSESTKTYALAVRSPPAGMDGRQPGADSRASPPEKAGVRRLGSHRLSGAKRQRSPTEATCGRCFRSSHKTAECRHQVVCLKCACVGHMAARCPVIQSPNRKRIHVRTKKQSTATPERRCEVVEQGVVSSATHQVSSKAALSLSLNPEAETAREELASVVVVTIVEGFVNEGSVLEVVPSIINKCLAGPITPLSDIAFLIPLASRDEVKEVCKLGSFKVATKDGPCTLKLSPWSAEIGTAGRASGRGQWITI